MSRCMYISLTVCRNVPLCKSLFYKCNISRHMYSALHSFRNLTISKCSTVRIQSRNLQQSTSLLYSSDSAKLNLEDKLCSKEDITSEASPANRVVSATVAELKSNSDAGPSNKGNLSTSATPSAKECSTGRNKPAVTFGFSKKSKSDQDRRQERPTTNHLNQTLGQHSKERRVPGSRIERIVNFGNLGVGLAFGTLSELAKRSVRKSNGSSDSTASAILDSNPLLTKDNAERIVETLCRVRGAALKLGQMMSIQDNSLINPQLQKIFERVRQSADYMPAWQMEDVMFKEFGSDWKSKLAEFDSTPFAAASIGQVHRAKTLDGLTVAMKIQYPGVQQSINSDISNIMALLNVWNVLPDGLYADSALKVARRELAWECDYLREAKCSQKFRELLGDDAVFYVPEVRSDLTTGQVLTTELVRGVSLDKLVDSDQQTRDFICENILRLCLTELFNFQFMQTDPNWSNFLYDKETERISLIDFGASRYFSRKFTDIYIQVIKAASIGDRQGVLDGSQKMGFLTGYESKVMENAHIDAVMILGEAFADDALFDFGRQSTASRIHGLMPIMLKHRLTPPPEETYSLHRKMAGCFLLCAKLRGAISCKKMFDNIYGNYQFGLEDNMCDDLV